MNNNYILTQKWQKYGTLEITPHVTNVGKNVTAHLNRDFYEFSHIWKLKIIMVWPPAYSQACGPSCTHHWGAWITLKGRHVTNRWNLLSWCTNAAPASNLSVLHRCIMPTLREWLKPVGSAWCLNAALPSYSQCYPSMLINVIAHLYNSHAYIDNDGYQRFLMAHVCTPSL